MYYNNNTDNDYNDYRNYLMHHGVRGQKWGVRRYQNRDGSLTEDGKRHYSKMAREDYNVDHQKSYVDQTKALREQTDRLKAENDYLQAVQNRNQLMSKNKSVSSDKIKKVVEVGSAIAGLAGTVVSIAGEAKKSQMISERKKKLGTMSDKELAAFNQRVESERKYLNVESPQSNAGKIIANGKKIADSVLKML